MRMGRLAFRMAAQFALVSSLTGEAFAEDEPATPAEVVITGKRSPPPGSAALSEPEVARLPGAFGDPFRAIEVLPGVTPVASGVPYFFVRGAPPGDVGYFLDGIRVPLLYHLGLGPSVVHPAMVDQVTLFPGGYPAQYGRFAGGIVTASTTPPSTDLHGEANLRLLDAGALVEAPFAEGRGAVLAGARYSYTGLLLSLISPTSTLDYWDYQGRVGYDVDDRDRVTVFAFGSYDYTGSKQGDEVKTVFSTQFHRLDLRLDHRFANGGNARVAATLGLDRTEFGEDGDVRDRMLATRSEIVYPISNAVTLRGGTDAILDADDIDKNPVIEGTINGDQIPLFAKLFPSRNDLSLGAHVDVVLKVAPGIELIPGLRGDFFTSQGETAIGLDPRVAATFAVSDTVRLVHAFGVAHQTPSYIIPLPGFQVGGLKDGLQSSVQTSAGVEWSPAPAAQTKLTLFQNAASNLTDALGTLRIPSGTSTDFLRRSSGHSIGAEVFVQRRLGGGLSGFVSYTLSRTTRTLDGTTIVSAFDRTHVLNTALAYDLGRGWRAGGRVAIYSGLPGPTDSSSLASPFGGSTFNDGGAIPSTGPRLAAFYRLDLRLEKRWTLGTGAWLSLTFELLNALFQKETLNASCEAGTCTPVQIGPITLPSIGLEAGF
jgi:hypothetical protein